MLVATKLSLSLSNKSTNKAKPTSQKKNKNKNATQAIACAIIIIIIIIHPQQLSASSRGVNNPHMYKEIKFLSGTIIQVNISIH